ncbi:L3 [Tursiops truncatus papillomavirus 4]|uniref:L3 n=1 Tax=Tursiops truncatus papillomavirus 4 TaxID=1144380 RepID=H6UYN8_9PAPI|nr:L3 [Tursiops truncatus papillomavirus 4]
MLAGFVLYGNKCLPDICGLGMERSVMLSQMKCNIRTIACTCLVHRMIGLGCPHMHTCVHLVGLWCLVILKFSIDHSGCNVPREKIMEHAGIMSCLCPLLIILEAPTCLFLLKKTGQ